MSLFCTNPRLAAVSRGWLATFPVLAVLAVASPHDTQAQSASIATPTPLGPGVNAGAADSMAGTRYVYFWAGPGAFKVSMGFKSMGMFGNPLRESLDFDYTNDQQAKISHNTVVSFDKFEHIEAAGSYPDRRRVTIAIVPQKAPVRTGGRYELEASGAVSFDAAGPLHGPAGKLSGEQSLIHPGGPLIHPGGPLIHPMSSQAPASGGSTASTAAGGASLVQPGGSLVHESGPLVKPGGPLVVPGGPLLKPLSVVDTPRELRLILAGDVLFDFDQAALRPEAQAALRQAAAVIRRHAGGAIRVEGFTDDKGGADYNLRLSERRASVVAQWLGTHAVAAPQRIRVEAFGAAHPVAPNHAPDGRDDPVGRQRNRRVELVVAKQGAG